MAGSLVAGLCGAAILGAAAGLLWCWRLHRGLGALVRISTLDTLTGLPNGRFFETERWPALVRSPSPLAVLFIDLDHLKQNNDRFGRATGDRYIRRAAAVLRQSCRRGVDEVFRLHTAGDEFVVVLQGAAAASADAIARLILARLNGAGISASVGVATTMATEREPREALLSRAEWAMRQAKARGRGCVAVAEAKGRDGDGESRQTPQVRAALTAEPAPATALATRRLEHLFNELAAIIPSRRFRVAAVADVPPLAVDDTAMGPSLLMLALYGACLGPDVQLVVSKVSCPMEVQAAAPLVEVRLKLDGPLPPQEPAILPLCLHACERSGASWGFDRDGLYTLWPVSNAALPSGSGS